MIRDGCTGEIKIREVSTVKETKSLPIWTLGDPQNALFQNNVTTSRRFMAVFRFLVLHSRLK